MDSSAKTLLTAHDLAVRLRVRTRTVRAWASAGRIPRVVLTPRAIRFDWDDVRAALAANAARAQHSAELRPEPSGRDGHWVRVLFVEDLAAVLECSPQQVRAAVENSQFEVVILVRGQLAVLAPQERQP